MGTLALLATLAVAGGHHAASTTAYSPCDGSVAVMADGGRVSPGVAASNRHPLGTLIRLDHRIRYHDDHYVAHHVVRRPNRWHRYLRIRDRIGWGSQLDIWMGRCADMNRWGRRTITYTVR